MVVVTLPNHVPNISSNSSCMGGSSKKYWECTRPKWKAANASSRDTRQKCLQGIASMVGNAQVHTRSRYKV